MGFSICCAQSLWSVVFSTSYLSQQPLAGDGKSFDIRIHAVKALVTTEFSVITSGVLLCVLAAGCGVCKRMQPVFQQAATETKGKYVSLLNLPPAHLVNCLIALTFSDLLPSFSDVCRLDEMCQQ